MALHLRADENGTRAWTAPPANPSRPSPSSTALPVSFDRSNKACLAFDSSSSSSSIRSSLNAMPPSVMVPVLSRFRQSTRASVSTDSSSCTSVFLRARRMAATAKFNDVSNTRPSGIMPTTPATAETTACRHWPGARACDQPPTAFICDQTSSTHNGTTMKVMTFRIVLMPLFKSEVVFLNTLASAVIFAA